MRASCALDWPRPWRDRNTYSLPQTGADCTIFSALGLIQKRFAPIRCHSLPTAPKKKRKKKTKLSLYRGFAPVKGPSAPKRENVLGFPKGRGYGVHGGKSVKRGGIYPPLFASSWPVAKRSGGDKGLSEAFKATFPTVGRDAKRADNSAAAGPWFGEKSFRQTGGFAPVKGPLAPKRENALGFSQGKGLWGRQTSPLAPAKKDFLRRRYSAPLKCKLSVNNCVIVPLHSTIGGLPPVG